MALSCPKIYGVLLIGSRPPSLVHPKEGRGHLGKIKKNEKKTTGTGIFS
jgi:hypothetical protein